MNIFSAVVKAVSNPSVTKALFNYFQVLTQSKSREEALAEIWAREQIEHDKLEKRLRLVMSKKSSSADK